MDQVLTQALTRPLPGPKPSPDLVWPVARRELKPAEPVAM
jgi:hypothetical protein